MERLEHSYKIIHVKRVVFVSKDLLIFFKLLGGRRGYNHVIDFENVLPICYLIIGVVQSAVYPEEGTNNITMAKYTMQRYMCVYVMYL